MQHIQQPTEFQENEGNELNSEFEDTINSANQKSEEVQFFNPKVPKD